MKWIVAPLKEINAFEFLALVCNDLYVSAKCFLDGVDAVGVDHAWFDMHVILSTTGFESEL